MKITKAQGRTCLAAMKLLGTKPGAAHIPVMDYDTAFSTVWSMANDGENGYTENLDRWKHHMIALAMCAAIAGVTP